MICRFKHYEPQIDDSCFIAPNSSVIGNVSIGRGSSIWYNTVIRGDVAGIRIGENTNIQDGSILHCASEVDLIIGNNVTVGHGVILHSCTIGDFCLIGMGAIILDGVKIGKNCMIGAGALLTPNTVIPEGSLVLGSPAKVKRELSEDETKRILRNSEVYVKLSEEYTSIDG